MLRQDMYVEKVVASKADVNLIEMERNLLRRRRFQTRHDLGEPDRVPDEYAFDSTGSAVTGDCCSRR